jgi:hypothetical protein
VLVTAQGGDEPRHADVAAQLAEGLGRLDEGDGDPAQDHRAAVPLGHVVGVLADAAVDELDGVGRRQRSFQPARQTERVDREKLRPLVPDDLVAFRRAVDAATTWLEAER